MPLDGREWFENQALATLRQVERLLAIEYQWCKGRLHDRHGRNCLVGAVMAADGPQELTPPIIRAVTEISGRHYWPIAYFNDDPGTSHRGVLRVVWRARVIIIQDIASADDESPSWRRKLADKIGMLFPVTGIASHLEGVGNDVSAVRARGKAGHPTRSDEYADA